MTVRPFASASLIAIALAAASAAHAKPVTAPAENPAPLAELVKSVDIPYQSFTLPNGLTVMVNTDRKAPVVAVSVWYKVGSKNEPKGKTGFAHLFEHLMFNGSENAPGDFFTPLQQIGATDVNGTTWFDRTNYFETVPTGALDMALMLESDRMGHLLGAVTQEKLDNQRSVVQNEKRQGDNRPFGLTEYEQLENLYPAGHPYHHSTIGSMADLDSASLEDVKGWFRDHYGPNNAVLVLSGDIDLATAKTKVAKWFGEIAPGPVVKPVAAPVPVLSAPKAKVIKDQVPTTRIYRMWAIPGLDNPDYLPLQLGISVLGGLASSRLDDALVRQGQQAVAVAASTEIFAQAGQLVVQADVKPGQDAAKVAQALDAEIAAFIKSGPNADELRRAATVHTASEIRGLETTGGFDGKAPTLAEGLLYNGDPAHYKKELARAAAMTPAQVKQALDRWLTKPAFALTVEPGERTEGGEARGGDSALPPPAPAETVAAAATGPKADRSKLPEVGQLAPLTFPKIERATLSNGMKVYFARRTAVPTVSLVVSFDAGFAADPKNALGTQAMLLRLMDEGTAKLDSTNLARARERLGAQISGYSDLDNTRFQLDALTPNLAPSLALLSDYVRNPALDPKELERVRAQQLNKIAGEFKDPGALARRVLMPALYGAAHPYGVPTTGTGDPAVVKKLTRQDLLDFHKRWLRPDKASVMVAGNTTLPELVRLLEANFGKWKAPAEPAPAKDFSVATPAHKPRIILVNRPGAPQSMIMAGRVLNARGSDDLLALNSANDVLGGNFLGRINMNLRETKGWSYGAFTMVNQPLGPVAFRVSAPVQSDKTGEAIAEIGKEMKSFLTDKGVTAEELDWTTKGSTRELPGSFETTPSVLTAVANIIRLGRPDNYYETLASRYSAMTAAGLDKAARDQLGDGSLLYVVVGDAAKVRPQLDKLGLPVEVANLDTAAPKGE